jgi:predicted metal-dependent hydrolase
LENFLEQWKNKGKTLKFDEKKEEILNQLSVESTKIRLTKIGTVWGWVTSPNFRTKRQQLPIDNGIFFFLCIISDLLLF